MEGNSFDYFLEVGVQAFIHKLKRWWKRSFTEDMQKTRPSSCLSHAGSFPGIHHLGSVASDCQKESEQIKLQTITYITTGHWEQNLNIQILPKYPVNLLYCLPSNFDLRSYTAPFLLKAGSDCHCVCTAGLRFSAVLLPLLFGTNPRSHHKSATCRVWTGNQRPPVLCHCQLGQDIPYSCGGLDINQIFCLFGNLYNGKIANGHSFLNHDSFGRESQTTPQR